MFNANQSAVQRSRQYAVAEDFCRIFNHDMNRLYLLSYLLTAEHGMAEECFVRGLEDSTRSNRVFQEWAESWAHRTIIHNAIQMIRPRPTEHNISQPRVRDQAEATPIAAVLGLPAFERFAFVMSVLERYPLHDTSVLLGYAHKDVMAARDRALQHIAGIAEISLDPISVAQHVAASA